MNKIIKNFFYILSGSIVSKILNFVFLLIAARHYGEEAFGSYNFARAIVSYFIMLASMGIKSYAVLLISKKTKNEKNIYREVISIELILGVICSFLLVMYTIVFPTNKTMVLLVGSTILINPFNIDWFYKAKQELNYVSYSTIMSSSLQCLLILFIVGLKLENIYILPLVVSFSNLISYIYLMKSSKAVFDLSFIPVKSNIYGYIKNGIPFLFSGVFAAINSNIDIIILGYMRSNKEVGLYSAAFTIVNMLVILISILFSPIYPTLVEAIAEKNSLRINTLLSTVSKIVLIFIVPVVVGGILLNKEIINITFGEKYLGVSQTFNMLLIYIGIMYFREVYGYVLSTSGNQIIYMNIVFFTCVVNIVMNIWLIPIFGMNGAAFTTILSELINFILMKKWAHTKVDFQLNDLPYIKVIICSFLMATIIAVVNVFNVNVIINIICGIITYLTFLIIFRVLTKEEYNKMFSIKAEKEELS